MRSVLIGAIAQLVELRTLNPWSEVRTLLAPIRIRDQFNQRGRRLEAQDTGLSVPGNAGSNPAVHAIRNG